MAHLSRLRALSPDLSYLPGAILLLASLAVYIWALIHYGQNQANQRECQDRLRGDEPGFVGNPDFYGLGIRLGIYLQWLASIIANLFLPSEWKGLFAAAVSFSVALLIALLLLTFQHDCAFTSEIIIVLYIVWGGFVIIVNSSPLMDFHKEVYGLGSVIFAALMAATYLLAFSTWFWHRLANFGEVDYLPTPGGTWYFLFGRISVDNYSAKKFLEVMCFYISAVCLATVVILAPTTFVMAFIEMKKGRTGEAEENLESNPQPGKENSNEDKKQDANDVDISHTSVARSDGVRSRQSNTSPAASVSASGHSLNEDIDPANSDAISRVNSNAQAGGVGAEEKTTDSKEVGSRRRRRRRLAPILRAIIGTATSTWVILAIELTLSWNSVTEIYSVNSSGQIIPLVIGGGLIVQTFWKLRWLAMNGFREHGAAHSPDDAEAATTTKSAASRKHNKASDDRGKGLVSAGTRKPEPHSSVEAVKRGVDESREKRS